jgi:RNA polymerase sigma factor (sigma-70 family)
MQEVLLKVAMRCPILSFESDHALVHWALEVARTTGLDCFRRARYRYRAKEVSVDDALSLVDESYVEPKEMETHYWAHGVGRIILETYDELPDLPAHLVWLRLIVRTSWSEAGEILGVSAKAAQNRYQRTLRALRRRIELRLSALSTDERVALTAQLMSRHPTLARPALSPSGEQGVIS